jgi:hypothetical protein
MRRKKKSQTQTTAVLDENSQELWDSLIAAICKHFGLPPCIITVKIPYIGVPLPPYSAEYEHSGNPNIPSVIWLLKMPPFIETIIHEISHHLEVFRQEKRAAQREAKYACEHAGDKVYLYRVPPKREPNEHGRDFKKAYKDIVNFLSKRRK